MSKVIVPPLAIGQSYGPITIGVVDNNGTVLPSAGDTFTVTSANSAIAIAGTIGTVMGTLQFNVTAVALGFTTLSVIDSAGSKQEYVEVTVAQLINLGTVDATITGP